MQQASTTRAQGGEIFQEDDNDANTIHTGRCDHYRTAKEPEDETDEGSQTKQSNPPGSESICAQEKSGQQFSAAVPADTHELGRVTEEAIPLAIVSRKNWQKSLNEATILWLKANQKVLHVLLANVSFMWIYYLPVIVLTPKLLDEVKTILYRKLLDAIALICHWSCINLAAAEIFSLKFTLKASVLALLPAYVVDNVIYFSPTLKGSDLFQNINNTLSLIFLAFGLYIIYKTKKPENMSAQEERNYALTKDGSVSSLFKGILGFFVLINFVFFNILAIYIKSAFIEKVTFRFVVFPVCFGLSQLIQIRFIFNLSSESMDKRLIVNKICNHYIQFIGRILISNISTNSALSYEFVSVNFGMAIIEVLSTVTFDFRTILSYKMQRSLASALCGLKALCANSRLRPLSPVDLTQIQDAFQDLQHSQASSVSIKDEETYLREANAFRVKYLYDEIVSEIYSLLLAPLLMYFLYPLLYKPSFQTISSFRECIYQIIIQLLCELSADLASLFYDIHNGRINPSEFPKWKPMNTHILFVWTVYCTLAMHSLIIIYS